MERVGPKLNSPNPNKTVIKPCCEFWDGTTLLQLLKNPKPTFYNVNLCVLLDLNHFLSLSLSLWNPISSSSSSFYFSHNSSFPHLNLTFCCCGFLFWVFSFSSEVSKLKNFRCVSSSSSFFWVCFVFIFIFMCLFLSGYLWNVFYDLLLDFVEEGFCFIFWGGFFSSYYTVVAENWCPCVFFFPGKKIENLGKVPQRINFSSLWQKFFFFL